MTGQGLIGGARFDVEFDRPTSRRIVARLAAGELVLMKPPGPLDTAALARAIEHAVVVRIVRPGDSRDVPRGSIPPGESPPPASDVERDGRGPGPDLEQLRDER